LPSCSKLNLARFLGHSVEVAKRFFPDNRVVHILLIFLLCLLRRDVQPDVGPACAFCVIANWLSSQWNSGTAHL